MTRHLYLQGTRVKLIICTGGHRRLSYRYTVGNLCRYGIMASGLMTTLLTIISLMIAIPRMMMILIEMTPVMIPMTPSTLDSDGDLVWKLRRLASTPRPSSRVIPHRKVVSMNTDSTAWSKNTFLAAHVKLKQETDFMIEREHRNRDRDSC